MIRIIYNTSKTVPLPLDANGWGPYYLFEVYSEMNNEVVKTFVTTDNSTSDQRAARYNSFNFVEVGTGNEDLYGGRFSLNDGTYLLRVYQQNSSGNLSPQGNIIYRDVLKVYGNTQQYQEYTDTPTDFTPYQFL